MNFSLANLQNELKRVSEHLKINNHLSNGRENLTFLISYKNSSLILRVYLSKEESQILPELDFLLYIKDFISVSIPIQIGPVMIIQLLGRPAVFFSKIEAEHIEYRNLNHNFFFKLGFNLGILHFKTSEISYRRFWCEKEIKKYLEEKQDLIQVINEKKIERIINESEKLVSVNNKPCIIHGDVSLKNLFCLMPSKRIYFIDFDDSSLACNGLDIGIVVRNFFLKGGIDYQYFKSFINGYTESNEFDFKETNSWVNFACLRYMFHMHEKSTIFDWYESDLEKNLNLLDKSLAISKLY